MAARRDLRLRNSLRTIGIPATLPLSLQLAGSRPVKAR